MEQQVKPSMLPVWQLSPWAQKTLEGVSEEYMHFESAMSGYQTAVEGANLGVDETPGTGAPLPDAEFYVRPLLGMEELPHALHRNYSELQGRTFMNHALVKVERVQGEASHPYLLTFARTITSPCTGITSRTSKKVTVRAGRVILALPKAALHSIEFKGSLPNASSLLESEVSRLLEAISGAPLMKFFAAFSSRFWQRVGVGAEAGFNVGRFTASSQVTQLFAWYPGTQARDADGQYAAIPEQCVSFSGADMGVMQMYATGDSSRSWAGMTQQSVQLRCNFTNVTSCEECFHAGNGFFVTQTNPAENHVTQQLLETWRMKVAAMFGVNTSEIPEPAELKYKIWHADDPQTQSDAFHFWKPGFQWWKLYDQVLQVGSTNSKLHIVGEAFSFHYGWGEGALETAEHMLQEHLGLPLPSWLGVKEYCLAMPYYPMRRRNLDTN